VRAYLNADMSREDRPGTAQPVPQAPKPNPQNRILEKLAIAIEDVFKRPSLSSLTGGTLTGGGRAVRWRDNPQRSKSLDKHR